jgi:cysteine desulfurase
MDANATTPLLPEVLDAMRPFLLERFGNASSIHQEGQHARYAVEHARAQVATQLGCRPSEVVFTSGGTESDNLAIFGSLQPGDHFLTTGVEHHAVLHAGHRLQDRGIEVTYLPVDGQGQVNPEDVRHALRSQTRLISVMMANNETGVLEPVHEIGRIAAGAGIRFHVDAVQAAGKIPLDVEAIGCHLLSISGHKMNAPQGTGALYVRRGTTLQPLFAGGAHERQRRAGTENVAGIVGLGHAATLPLSNNAVLRDRLEAGLLERTSTLGMDSGRGVNSGNAPRVPNTTNLWFDHLEGEALVIALDLKGLAVSSGAACSSGASEPSHVLEAIGLPPARARSSVRFSLHRQTTEAEVDQAIDLVAAQVSRLRELATVTVR